MHLGGKFSPRIYSRIWMYVHIFAQTSGHYGGNYIYQEFKTIDQNKISLDGHHRWIGGDK